MREFYFLLGAAAALTFVTVIEEVAEIQYARGFRAALNFNKEGDVNNGRKANDVDGRTKEGASESI